MGIFDKLTSLADKALKSVENTSEKVTTIYKKEGVEGFLDRADKGLGKLEEKASQLTGAATSYAKDIAKSNKVVIEKAKKSSDDDVSTVLSSTVAVAVNTVSTVAKDVAKKANELMAKEIIKNPDDKANKAASNAFEYFRFSEADAVDLEKVLKFVGAKPNKEAKNKFTDSHGNNLSIQGKSWYDWNNSQGGTGAVSLLKYELDLSYKSTKVKSVSSEDVQKEAVNILEQMSLRQQVLDKEVSSKNESPVQVRAPAKKISAKKSPVKGVFAKKTSKTAIKNVPKAEVDVSLGLPKQTPSKKLKK